MLKNNCNIKYYFMRSLKEKIDSLEKILSQNKYNYLQEELFNLSAHFKNDSEKDYLAFLELYIDAKIRLPAIYRTRECYRRCH